MNFLNKGKQTVIAVNDINKQWSNDPIKLVVNTDKVSNFYPSRINLEYMSDKDNNLYLVKNKGWDYYLGIPTVLDSSFSNQELITKEELNKGIVNTVHDYNIKVLRIAKEIFDIDSPDLMDINQLDIGIQKVVQSIDELINSYKYIEQGDDTTELTSEQLKKISHLTLNMEVLGSVYSLYRARKRILKRS